MNRSSDQLVRAITDVERSFYADHGWVELEQLITAELASEMLSSAKRLMGESGAERERRPGIDVSRFFLDYQRPARESIEPFASFALSAEVGLAVHTLMDRRVGVRYGHDMIAARPPGGGQITHPHQDFPATEFDRVGYVNLWIALDEVTAERGGMRFYSGSHKAGPLGLRHAMEGGNDPIDLLATYPDLPERYPLSPPLHLQPGDATAHGMLTVHTAQANLTDATRWSYIAWYVPADVLRIAAPTNLHGDLKVGEPVDGPDTPIIWEPAD